MEGRINIGALLHWVPPDIYDQNFIIIFIVLVINCFMLALTIRMLRGSHILITLLYFIPFVWVVAVTSFIVEFVFGGMLV
jgi:archaellum biogenesis protein FlaJ (TadC family)